MTKEAMQQALEVLEINLVFLRNVKPFKGQENLASDCVAMTEEIIFTLEEALKQEQDEPVAYINVEQRKLEWAKYTSWETPTVANLPKIPLYIKPQPKQEQDDPVAYVYGNGDNDPILSWSRWDKSGREGWHETPLYTTPQTKEWVELTNEQIVDLVIKNAGFPTKLAKAIENKLKELNK